MSIFQEYAEIQGQIKSLEIQLKALKPQVLAEMPGRKHKVDGVEFSISRRKKWHYTPAVIEAEEMVKGMKRGEEKTGAATYEEIEILSCKL
jgi:hypothetical protein